MSLFHKCFSHILYLVITKGHTYFNKPAAKSCSCVSVYEHGITFCCNQALKGQGQIKKRNEIFYKSRPLIKKYKMTKVINNNKHKLKF